MGFVLKSVWFYLGFFVISLGFSYKTLGNYLLTFSQKTCYTEIDRKTARKNFSIYFLQR